MKFLSMEANLRIKHCAKSVRIRSYFGSYSVRMRGNTDQNNSEYGHFLRSGIRDTVILDATIGLFSVYLLYLWFMPTISLLISLFTYFLLQFVIIFVFASMKVQLYFSPYARRYTWQFGTVNFCSFFFSVYIIFIEKNLIDLHFQSKVFICKCELLLRSVFQGYKRQNLKRKDNHVR